MGEIFSNMIVDSYTMNETYTAAVSSDHINTITSSPPHYSWEASTNINLANEEDVAELKERMNRLEERLRELELEILMK